MGSRTVIKVFVSFVEDYITITIGMRRYPIMQVDCRLYRVDILLAGYLRKASVALLGMNDFFCSSYNFSSTSAY